MNIKNIECQHLYGIFLFLFALSLPTSKAGMNIFVILFVITTITITARRYKEQKPEFKKLVVITFSLFFIGLIFSLVSNFDIRDIVLFFRKNIYLLIIPILTISLQNKKHKENALIFFVFATFLSCIFSIYNFVFIDKFNLDARSLGFLEYSRHINVILLSLSCILVWIFYKNKKITARLLFSIVIVTILVSLVISGTRGGWLAASIIIIFFSIFHMKKKALYLFATCILAIVVIMQIMPDKLNEVYNRAASIFDVSEKNVSNSARLTMWRGGIDYILSTRTESPINFLFGNGMASSDKKYHEFITSLPKEQRIFYRSNGQYVGGSDFHNTYLDLYAKQGVIYSTIILALFFYVIYLSFKNKNTDSCYLKITSCYFIGLLTITPFYSLLQDYSTYTIAFAVALTLSDTLGMEYENKS